MNPDLETDEHLKFDVGKPQPGCPLIVNPVADVAWYAQELIGHIAGTADVNWVKRPKGLTHDAMRYGIEKALRERLGWTERSVSVDVRSYATLGRPLDQFTVVLTNVGPRPRRLQSCFARLGWQAGTFACRLLHYAWAVPEHYAWQYQRRNSRSLATLNSTTYSSTSVRSTS